MRQCRRGKQGEAGSDMLMVSPSTSITEEHNLITDEKQ